MKAVPGITVMVLRARRTLKVLSAETLPMSTNSVRYLEREPHVNQHQPPPKDTHTQHHTRPQAPLTTRPEYFIGCQSTSHFDCNICHLEVALDKGV